MTAKNSSPTPYPDNVKVAALAAYDISHQTRATARDFGIPSSTLRSWIKAREAGVSGVDNLDERIALTKKSLMDQTLILMDKSLKQIDAKIDKATAIQAATIFGILHDKLAVMQGQVEAAEGATINNTFILNMQGSPEAVRLMQRSLSRMRSDNAPVEAQDVVFETVEDTNAEKDDE